MNIFKICILLLCPAFLFSQEWSQLSSLPDSSLGRNHAISFGINGYGYLLTGNAGSSNQLEDMLRYDPQLDSWQKMPNFPGGKRGYAYGVTNGLKAYVGFGRYYDDNLGANVWHKDLWAFDPETETWTELAACPCEARIHPALVATKTKVFVGLGGGQESGDMNDWWEYDIATDSWSQKPDFPAERRHHPYYFGTNDQVYVGFGHHSTKIFDDFYHYDPETEVWTATSQFPAEGRVAGTQFDYNGRGYVLSGQGEDHDNLDTGEFWEYNPDTDSWLELEPHPGIGRWAPATFLIENKLFFMTGQTDIEEKDLWVYPFDPIMSNTDDLDLLNFKFYPNPTSNSIHIEYEKDHSISTIYLTDVLGRLVKKVNTSPVDNQIIIDVSDVVEGSYFLSTDTQQSIHTIPVIIQR